MLNSLNGMELKSLNGKELKSLIGKELNNLNGKKISRIFSNLIFSRLNADLEALLFTKLKKNSNSRMPTMMVILLTMKLLVCLLKKKPVFPASFLKKLSSNPTKTEMVHLMSVRSLACFMKLKLIQKYSNFLKHTMELLIFANTTRMIRNSRSVFIARAGLSCAQQRLLISKRMLNNALNSILSMPKKRIKAAVSLFASTDNTNSMVNGSSGSKQLSWAKLMRTTTKLLTKKKSSQLLRTCLMALTKMTLTTMSRGSSLRSFSMQFQSKTLTVMGK